MSKLFDGSDDELTLGQALVAVAEQCSWPTEEHRKEVVRAIQKEYDLVPPEPDVTASLNDPRDLSLIHQNERIQQLEKQLAAERRERELQAQLAEQRQQPPVTNPVETATAGKTDQVV